MLSFGALGPAPIAAQARPSGTAARCQESCGRYAREARLRAACERCLSDDDRGAWAAALADAPHPFPKSVAEAALTDKDWAVRWGAHRALARFKGVSAPRQLAAHVLEASPGATLLACATAARVAADAQKSLSALLQPAGGLGASAASVCQRRVPELLGGLELELYDPDPLSQLEALEHLAQLQGVEPARAAFAPMRKREPSTDPVIAPVLRAAAARRKQPVGVFLIARARKEDEPLINRLLAIYSKDIDAAQPLVRSTDARQRLEGARRLAELVPFSASELSPLLEDVDPTVRLEAVRALAAGEQRSVLEAAKARLSGQGKASKEPVARQRAWIDAVGQSGDRACGAALVAWARTPGLPEALRAASYGALGQCMGPDGFAAIGPGLSDKSAKVRAAAVDALASMPRHDGAERAAVLALQDGSPEVRAVAVRTLKAQGQRARGAELVSLLADPSPVVRAEAAEALGALSASVAVQPLAERLKTDAAAPVRVAAARALGLLGGGPVALEALTQAAARDSDGRVRMSAKASLERLGL